jgi:hypothetical protein
MKIQTMFAGPRARRRPQEVGRLGSRAMFPNLTVMLTVLASLLLADAAGAADTAQQQATGNATALLKAAAITCTVVDARKLSPADAAKLTAPAPGKAGSAQSTGVASLTINNAADAGGQSVTSSGAQGEYAAPPPKAVKKVAAVDAYEVVCSEGLGYIISAGATASAKPSAYLCIEAVSGSAIAGTAPDANGLAPCALPGNLEAAQLTALQLYVTQAGIGCDASHLRGVGQTDTDMVVELACAGGSGYILSIPYPLQPGQPVKSANCLSLTSTSRVTCQLTDVTAQKVTAEVQLRQSHPTCQVSASRYMVSSLHGDNYFEFLCDDGTGLVLQQKPSGMVGGIVACSAAIVDKLGGCQLHKETP